MIATKPLGEVLYSAGLISKAQLDVALYDRANYQEMKIGEILNSRGWIEVPTADFFAEEWSDLAEQKEKYPLGFYLQKAALLNKEHVGSILMEQNQTSVRFGSLAVLKGLINQKTLDFFLYNLFPQEMNKSSFIAKKIKVDEEPSNEYSQAQLDSSATIVDEEDEDDIVWVD